MSPPPPPPPPFNFPHQSQEDIVRNISDYVGRVHVMDWTTVMSLTLLVYDIAITWDREIFYVWRTRWSYAKAIFLVNRYLAPVAFIFRTIAMFVTPPSISFCIASGYVFGILAMIVPITGTSVIMARTWALYGRNRIWIIVFLIFSYIVAFFPGFYITYKGFASGKALSDTDFATVISLGRALDSIPGQRGKGELWVLTRCYGGSVPVGLEGILLGSLVYESMLFCAMLYKMRQEKRERERIVPEPRSRIIDEFYRDGVMYYVCLFAVLSAGTIGAFLRTYPVAQAYVSSDYFVAVKSILISRIILRLRSYFSRGSAVVGGGGGGGGRRFQYHLTEEDSDATAAAGEISTGILFAVPPTTSTTEETSSSPSMEEWTTVPEPKVMRNPGARPLGPGLKRLAGQPIGVVRKALELDADLPPVDGDVEMRTLRAEEGEDVPPRRGGGEGDDGSSPIRRWMHLPPEPPPPDQKTHSDVDAGPDPPDWNSASGELAAASVGAGVAALV